MNNMLELQNELDEAVLEAVQKENTGTRPWASSRSATRYRPVFFVNGLITADFVSLLAAGFLGFVARFGSFSHLSSADHMFLYMSSIVTLIGLHLGGSYRIRAMYSLNHQLSSLLIGCISALFVVILCGFLSGNLRDFSRIWIVFSAGIGFALLTANRVIAIRTVKRAVGKKYLSESIVIVGANEHAEKIIETLQKKSPLNIDILGIFEDRIERAGPAALTHKVVGSTDELITYVRNNRVDRVVVTLPWVATERINTILKKLRTVPVRIDLVPNSVIWQFSGINMDELGGVPILTVANGRVDSQIGWVKRASDIVLSSILLLLTSPLLLAIAIAVKLDSKGPVFFKQRRHGFNNQIFEVYKFRSMAVAASNGPRVEQAKKDDPRITRVGKFLRRSSLDELPQLVNVLSGSMSIVGPRPHAVQHNVEYGSIISEYFARHNVRPGITGWAQVNGLRGETDTVEKMHRRVDADLYYIENWSLMLDIKIIFLTAFTVWFQENAY